MAAHEHPPCARGSAWATEDDGTFHPPSYGYALLWPVATRGAAVPNYYRAYAALGFRRPWTSGEIIVLTVLFRALGRDASSGGAFNCFLSYAEIARRATLSRRSVIRIMERLRSSPVPLVQIQQTGETRGIVHRCFRFTLVRDPLAFAEARDRERRTRQHAAAEHGRLDKIVIQKAYLLDDDRPTYDRRIKEFERGVTRRTRRRQPLTT